jgi:hypothetical protein
MSILDRLKDFQDPEPEKEAPAAGQAEGSLLKKKNLFRTPRPKKPRPKSPASTTRYRSRRLGPLTNSASAGTSFYPISSKRFLCSTPSL